MGLLPPPPPPPGSNVGGPLRLPPGGVPIIPEADSLALLGGGLAVLALAAAVRVIRRRLD
jgi:hypothetical protein